jgi:hypothetical protein
VKVARDQVAEVHPYQEEVREAVQEDGQELGLGDQAQEEDHHQEVRGLVQAREQDQHQQDLQEMAAARLLL